MRRWIRLWKNRRAHAKVGRAFLYLYEGPVVDGNTHAALDELISVLQALDFEYFTIYDHNPLSF